MEMNTGLTQYEFAKQRFESGAGDEFTETKTIAELTNISAWFSTEKYFQYFMLLCREAYDFTVINIKGTNYHKAMTEVQEVLESRGKIVFIEYCHDSGDYEIWIKTNEQMKTVTGSDYVMFKLFPCNDFVIEVD